MKYKTKSIIKKVALALAGIVAVSAVGVGVAKLVEYMQDDLKTISPSFDVGNLGADGKYVNDESTLYTKEAFQCDGLQIKLDFDNEIDYQIFFYDDLDNFIESTEVLSAAYSETVHDGYARIVIIPNNDEDGKIGLTERLTYPGQMTIKVAKEQTSEYYLIFNKRLREVDNIIDLRFDYGGFVGDDPSNFQFVPGDTTIITSRDILSVESGESVRCDYSSFDEGYHAVFRVIQFKKIDGKFVFISNTKEDTVTLDDDTTHILIVFGVCSDSDSTYLTIPEEVIESFSQHIVIE